MEAFMQPHTIYVQNPEREGRRGYSGKKTLPQKVCVCVRCNLNSQYT